MPKTGVFSAIFVHFAQKTKKLVIKSLMETGVSSPGFVQFAQKPATPACANWRVCARCTKTINVGGKWLPPF